MMKRRQLIRYTGASLLAAVGTVVTAQFSQAQTPAKPSANSLTIQWLGHTCFLFTGNNKRILINPFRPVGCTAKYRLPNVQADLVLISSQLLDEGAIESVPGNPRLLYEPGVYQVDNIKVEGIRTQHDREGGRRFGTNVAWRWQQSGLNILHLGGLAAPINIEQKILMGTPDIVLIPVGGGPKAYNPEEAKQAIKMLNPKWVIPTHYRTSAADENACDLVAVDQFLGLMDGTPVRRMNADTITLKTTDLPKEGTEIKVLSYKF